MTRPALTVLALPALVLRVTPVVIAAILASNCSSGTRLGEPPNAQVAEHRAAAEPSASTAVLTDQQLVKLPRTSSLYEAVVDARPDILRYRNTSPTVYLDGRLFGGIDALQRIPLASVQEVRLLSRTEATFRYGVSHTGTVLEVTTRRR
jgi:hypothetical protein